MTSRTMADFWKSLWFEGGSPQRIFRSKSTIIALGAHSAPFCSLSHTSDGGYALPKSAASSAIRIYMPLRIWRK